MPSGGARQNAGRKSNAQKLLDAQAAAESLASWFTPDYQKSKWTALLESEDESVQYRAISYLSDRLYGKAPQSVDMNLAGKDGGPIQAAVAVTFVRTNGGDQ